MTLDMTSSSLPRKTLIPSRSAKSTKTSSVALVVVAKTISSIETTAFKRLVKCANIGFPRAFKRTLPGSREESHHALRWLQLFSLSIFLLFAVKISLMNHFRQVPVIFIIYVDHPSLWQNIAQKISIRTVVRRLKEFGWRKGGEAPRVEITWLEILRSHRKHAFLEWSKRGIVSTKAHSLNRIFGNRKNSLFAVGIVQHRCCITEGPAHQLMVHRPLLARSHQNVGPDVHTLP